MKDAIYAGSFDPWSFGHQYVLECATEVFRRVTILIGVNPEKRGTLPVLTRARVIAHALNPFEDWWEKELPFHVSNHLIIDATEGLVADYARHNKVTHLVRGLRSTSDFESEFSLYFSNRAIQYNLQTWAIMCPPELIHCSSTYVRTVVGKRNVAYVGTTFVAQCLMLGRHKILGQILDLIQRCSQFRFENEGSDLNQTVLQAALQTLFAEVAPETAFLSDRDLRVFEDVLGKYIEHRAESVRSLLANGKYPSIDVAILWSLLVHLCAQARPGISVAKTLRQWTGTIGHAGVTLIDVKLLEKILLVTSQGNVHPAKQYFKGNVFVPELKALWSLRKDSKK